MKNRLIPCVLACLMIFLVGCNGNTAKEAAQEITKTETSFPAGNTETDSQEETAEEPESTTVQEETPITAEESQSTAERQTVATVQTKPAEEKTADTPATEKPKAEPPKQTTTQAEPEKQTEQPKEQTTAEQKPVEKPTEKPAEPKPTEPHKQTFDVSPYVSYAKEYAVSIGLACSLRMGEMLGLTWDCIDISEESLKENNASIFVDKELQRVNRDVMEVLDNKDIIRVFPRTLSNTNTSLVLKTPKTKTSVRKIFLPSTVAQMLLERKKQIDEMKELFGDEYLDYDLVFCHSSGRPMEGQVINRALKKLIQDNDLPDVVFHSFRHASITYKLKWNGGDMKSVQGDSGHARMDMVADVYSHIIDEDRRYNAQKFEEQFYNAKGLKNAEEGKTAPMPKFETSVELLDPMAEVQKESEVEKEKPAENSTDENAALLTKLLSNPETAALLKALAKTI